MSNFQTWFNQNSEEAKEQFLGENLRLLLEGKQYETLCKILGNFYFIQAKINHPSFGLQALIEDYDLLDKPELSSNPKYAETIKALKLIPNSFLWSAPIIYEDPKQLNGQLSARLAYFDVPEINQLLAQIAADKIINLYNIPISLSSEDFNNIGKLIYLLFNIIEQNLNDISIIKK